MRALLVAFTLSGLVTTGAASAQGLTRPVSPSSPRLGGAADAGFLAFYDRGGSETGAFATPPIPGLDMRYAGTLSPGPRATEPLTPSIVLLRPGNRISFCPPLSCVYGPGDHPFRPMPSFFDHQRTSVLVAAETQDDAHSEEQTLAVVTSSRTGAKRRYAARTAYAAGDAVVVGNAAYRVVAAGTTGVNSAPPPTRPTAAQTGDYKVVDGSVTWQWINDGAITTKLGIYNEVGMYPGAGFTEALTNNLVLQPGADPKQGVYAQENDCTNNSGTDFAPVVANGDCLVAFLGGTNHWLTAFSLVGKGASDGTGTARWGLRAAGKLATEYDVGVVDTVSRYAFFVGNDGYSGTTAHAGADYFDNSSSAKGYLDEGKHAFAAVSLAGTGRSGLSLTGAWTEAQIEGKSFKVDAKGNTTTPSVQMTPVTIARLPACSPSTKGLVAFVSDGTAAAPPSWHGRVAGGGATSVDSLVSCSGRGWQYE